MFCEPSMPKTLLAYNSKGNMWEIDYLFVFDWIRLVVGALLRFPPSFSTLVAFFFSFTKGYNFTATFPLAFYTTASRTDFRVMSLLLLLLHSTTKTKNEVKGGLPLDVVVRDSAAVFELLAGED